MATRGVNERAVNAMLFRVAACVLCIGLSMGCRPPDVLYRPVPALPDLWVYGGGVFFISMDGLDNFKEVAVVPGRLNEPVRIQLPDGAQVEAKDLTPKFLRDHKIDFTIDGDDGKGDDGNGRFNLITSVTGLFARFTSHRAEIIILSSKRGSVESPYAVIIKGETFHVPIKRTDLERLLGKPDEVKMNTSPPDR